MKQIINGKLYDTDKCEKIHEIPLDDMICIILKTPNGAHVGLKVNQDVENIILDERMLKMVLGYRFPDLYIELFGEVEEG